MKVRRSHFLSFSIGFLIVVTLPTQAFTLGFNGVGSAPCNTATQNLVGTFSSNKAQYLSTGTCTTSGSLGAPRTFPYTVQGAYANNIAEELIEIPLATRATDLRGTVDRPIVRVQWRRSRTPVELLEFRHEQQRRPVLAYRNAQVGQSVRPVCRGVLHFPEAFSRSYFGSVLRIQVEARRGR